MKKKRSNIMTKARIQPCLRKVGANLCYYKRKRKWPRNITEKNIG